MKPQRISQQTIVFAVFALMFAGFALLLPGFARVDNLLTLLQNVAILGIWAWAWRWWSSAGASTSR